MPASKRKIKPTFKAVSQNSTSKRVKTSSTTSKTAIKARARPVSVDGDSILDAETPPPPPKPNPVHYIVAWTIQFESEMLERSSKVAEIDGGCIGGFRASTYKENVEELVKKKTEKEGMRAYCYKNEITIHPLDRKAKNPIIVDWRDFDDLIWNYAARPAIQLLAGEAKKGQSATISVAIETVYSRYQGRLPDITVQTP